MTGTSDADTTDPWEAHAAFLRTAPDEAQIAAIGRELDAGGYRSMERLRGGVETSVYRIAYEARTVVVRRYDAGWPHHSEARARREVRTLTALGSTPVPAPAVLLADPDGSTTGGPLVVLSLLPGRGIPPPTDDVRLRAFARTLRTIHDQRSDEVAEDWLTDWRREPPPGELVGAPRAEEVWDAVVSVQAELAAEPLTLAHHDFHIGNTLWRDGEVSGVVDWGHAAAGPPAYDAAYCALDLALCAGPEVGQRFLRHYEAEAGRRVHPGWRAVAATRAMPDLASWHAGWVDAGIDVTLEQLHARLEAWIDDALHRTRSHHRR